MLKSLFFLNTARNYTCFLLFFICGVLYLSHTGYALTFQSQMEYQAYYQSPRNIFLTDPELVKSVFFEIAELRKGSQKRHRRIKKHLFSCGVGDPLTSNCFIDRLYSERKRKQVRRKITLPFQVSSIENRRYNRRKSQLTIRIKHTESATASLSLEDFMQLINIAEDSALFSLKKNIHLIKLNIVLPNKVPILINKKDAENIVSIYKIPPSDDQDTIRFKLDHHSFTKYLDTISLNLNFKAEAIKINNQRYQVEPENLLLKNK